ncbi:MAG: hypothetical protein WB677_27795 [Xanthobacteraceae bacterium]
MEHQSFFGLDGLTDLGKRGGIDMRPTLLRVLTDLYVHRLSHSADEERHYTELALRMLEAVDVPTRVAVAKRFAHYPAPPLRVLQWLARDLPAVAAELRSHPLLQATSAPPPGFGAPAPYAEGNLLGEEPQPRRSIPTIDVATASELNELFFTATANERRLILLNLHVVEPGPGLHSPIAAHASIGEELETAALTGKREHFAVRLAHALRISHEQARRIANDQLGEPVVVAGKALALRRDVLYRILMFVNPSVGHSVERVHTLAALYDELTLPAAEDMLTIWQALHMGDRARAGQGPFLRDDEIRRPARAGAPTQRNSAAPQTKEFRSAS